MRRSSIITIILLVLVIIGLTVALVFTNLPKEKVDDSTGIENNEDDVVLDNENNEEKPNYIALDSNIAKDMATIIHPYGYADFFYNSKTGTITQKDFTDKEKIYIAYNLFASKNQVDSDNKEYRKMISKSDMDNAIYKIFGNTDYKPMNVSLGFLNLKYDNETERFYDL